MIQMFMHGLCCPTITCDGCQQPIVDAGDANAYWLDYPITPRYAPVWHVHKTCSGFDSVLERRHGPDAWCCSEDLDLWLGQLVRNAEHTEEKVPYLARGNGL